MDLSYFTIILKIGLEKTNTSYVHHANMQKRWQNKCKITKEYVQMEANLMLPGTTTRRRVMKR